MSRIAKYVMDIDILKKVRHEHIVSLHDIFEDTNAVYIISDLCTGGELFQRIVERGTYTEAVASDLVRQMLEGLAYLHSQNVCLEPCFSAFDAKKRLPFIDCSPRYQARKRKMAHLECSVLEIHCVVCCIVTVQDAR